MGEVGLGNKRRWGHNGVEVAARKSCHTRDRGAGPFPPGLWADLHTHTRASDGTLSPARLVEEAQRIGLGAIAITDHDTLDGILEARERAEALGMWVISGIEVSVDGGDGRSFHLLGYGVDAQSASLRAFLDRLQESRQERNRLMLEKLARIGFHLDEFQEYRRASGAQLGRPHMALALVKRGYVSSVEEAFARLLAKGGQAYVPREKPGYREAIRAILEAGCVPVLAHPHTVGCESSLGLEAFVGRLVDAGLMGIEAVYPEGGVALEALCRSISCKWNLILTGGTDFHGRVKPQIQLGWGRGTLRVPLAWAEALAAAIERVRA